MTIMFNIFLLLNSIISITRYDTYVFTRSWIPSFCKFNNQSICNNNYSNYDKFTIHGLWPNWNNNSWPQYCNNRTIDIEMLNSIMPDMSMHWSDDGNPSMKLWNHEWNKHGTCSLDNLYVNTSNDYFSNALWINMRLNSKYALDSNNILPSYNYPYTKLYLENIFRSSLVCKKENSKYLLTELRNQISLNFSIISPSIDDNSCGDTVYIIPPG